MLQVIAMLGVEEDVVTRCLGLRLAFVSLLKAPVSKHCVTSEKAQSLRASSFSKKHSPLRK
jgi:hypothetical protein